MIEYRTFKNPDPPKILQLWEECQLGHGAASGFSCYSLETVCFSQPYFDPLGVVLAIEDGKIVGFAHAGFEPNEQETALAYDTGVICAIMVHPQYRRRGIAKSLVEKSITYLKSKDVTTIFAGGTLGRSPYYVGIYGGTLQAGFLHSDEAAAPFLKTVGFEPKREYTVFKKSLDKKTAFNFRLFGLKRKYELECLDQPTDCSWWWQTRFGRLDSLQFTLLPKQGGEPVASISAVRLEMYASQENGRSIGLFGLEVAEENRRKGFAQMLILETLKCMQEELFTSAEMNIPADDERLAGILKSCQFEQADTGTVYQLTESPS